MKTHTLPLDVHIFDTDCYGVMWHGAYAKWLEMGRVNLFKALGVPMSLPGDTSGYVFPVVEQNLRYRAPARLNDPLVLTTRVEAEGCKLQFYQRVENTQTGTTTLEARTTVAVVDTQWKPQRRLPSEILDCLSD